ncbi:MAG TPA: molecular chaperone DnaJ [Acidimicrobiales bacterium]
MAPQREWFEKDYYQVLGVSGTATEKEITRAYRKLAKQYHPDANPGSEDRFKDISAAYDVLGDPARRKEYDEVRRLGPAGGMFGGGGPGGDGAGPFTNVRVEDLSDLLGGMFRGGGRTRTRSTSGPRRGEDLEAELYLSFEDAIDGVTTTINVVSEVACATCHGTGAAPGTSPVICSQCGGRGVTADNQGMFSFSSPCRACAGTGMRVETPCPTCQGTGNTRRPRQVKTKIQPGVEDGKRLRLKARGGSGHNGGPPGDLYVTVHVGRHDLFGRRGKDLLVAVPITFAEAALGATVTVPTLDKPVKVKIPPGTRSGRTFRVRGHGVPDPKGAGDLLATVEVAVPQHLSDAERKAIEDLRAASDGSPRSHLGV